MRLVNEATRLNGLAGWVVWSPPSYFRVISPVYGAPIQTWRRKFPSRAQVPAPRGLKPISMRWKKWVGEGWPSGQISTGRPTCPDRDLEHPRRLAPRTILVAYMNDVGRLTAKGTVWPTVRRYVTTAGTASIVAVQELTMRRNAISGRPLPSIKPGS